MSNELHPSASRDQRVDAVIAAYLEAVDAGRAPDRHDLLARHPDLAAELEIFFADHDRVDQLAQPLRPPAPAASRPTEAEVGAGGTPFLGPALGTKIRYIGDYELLEELGRGGMGVVYKARQTSLRRLVALKMILAGEHAGPKELGRFRGEGQAVARLQHPNIVQIFEVGDYDGHPYFSLEFVDGGSLAQKLDGAPWPPHPAARLVETLAAAMHAAHQAGVVHRDLKPANVLLTAHGAPKITDFGLAKKLDDAAGPTASGAILGTPSYMAPEQAAGKKEVGPAADVYALGAILYQLLTGRPPFRAATPLETVLQVVSDEPAPPRQLQSKTPRDLETICLKCLSKEPRKRYASAAALADDLRRFQEGQPIAARPAGWVERGWRWRQRNPAMAGLAAAVAVSLLAGAAGASYFAVQAAARAAETERERVRAVHGEAEANTQLDYARSTLMTTQLLRVAALMTRDPDQGVDLLNDPTACPRDRRDFAWGFYYGFCKRDRLTLAAHDPLPAAIPADGLPNQRAGANLPVAITADGRGLGLASVDGAVKLLWDADTRPERTALLANAALVPSVAFTADRKTLAWAGEDGAVRVWDLDEGRERAVLKGNALSVAFTPDGKTLASGTYDGTVKLWDVATGRERTTFKGLAGYVMCVAFAPDGKTLASGTGPGPVKLWDVAAGTERATLTGHSWVVLAVAFAPDGKTLASAGADHTVRLWDVTTGQQRAILKGHNNKVWSVAFSPDGKTLASGSDDATVKLWDVSTGQERTTLRGHTAVVSSLAFTPNGKTLASWSGDHTVKLWDVRAEQERATLQGHEDRVVCLAISADGKTLASGSWDHTVRLWDVATGQERATLKQADWIHSLAFAPDGKTLASASEDGAVKLWDVTAGQERATLQANAGRVWSVAFMADGKTLASVSSGSGDNTVKLWDVATGQERAAFKGPAGQIFSVAFTPDGKAMAWVNGDQTVRLWDVATGKERASFKGATGENFPLAFTADGKTLALMFFDDDAVRLWDVATGRERAALKGHKDKVSSLAFTPDGKTLALGCWNGLAAGSEEGAVRLLDAATGQERAALEGHTRGVTSVAFTADGKTLASGNGDGTIKLWEAVFPEESNRPAGETKPR